MPFVYEALASIVYEIHYKLVYLGHYRLLTWRGSKPDCIGFRYFYLLASEPANQESFVITYWLWITDVTRIIR